VRLALRTDSRAVVPTMTLDFPGRRSLVLDTDRMVEVATGSGAGTPKHSEVANPPHLSFRPASHGIAGDGLASSLSRPRKSELREALALAGK